MESLKSPFYLNGSLILIYIVDKMVWNYDICTVIVVDIDLKKEQHNKSTAFDGKKGFSIRLMP